MSCSRQYKVRENKGDQALCKDAQRGEGKYELVSVILGIGMLFPARIRLNDCPHSSKKTLLQTYERPTLSLKLPVF